MISESYGRGWSTGPDEPRVQLELEYRRRALERGETPPVPERLHRRSPLRSFLDACVRLRRALPWAA